MQLSVYMHRPHTHIMRPPATELRRLCAGTDANVSAAAFDRNHRGRRADDTVSVLSPKTTPMVQLRVCAPLAWTAGKPMRLLAKGIGAACHSGLTT